MSKITSILSAVALTITATSAMAQTNDKFEYKVDRFADIQVLRYQVSGFDELSLQQKTLIYYLSEAAAWGRDIHWDQQYKHNLAIRQMLEAVYTAYSGDRSDKEYAAFELYFKRVQFANGIHHHYSADKFVPEFSQQWLEAQVAKLPAGAWTPVQAEVFAAIFDPNVAPKRTSQDTTGDVVASSTVNFYEGLTQAEVEAYYANIKDPNDPTPVMYGLNTRLVKQDGKIVAQTYKLGGLYTEAIEHIVENLTKAMAYAENEAQRMIIARLINYYTTGDLKDFDDYSILWAKDTHSQVDFVNGFIESYNDPLGMVGSWESIVNFKNLAASHRTEVLAENANWFEQHSPVDPRFRKDKVKGVSAKVITAAMLAGDAYPATPIGINLPNSNWIRAQHGSKSVTIENITAAYDAASQGNGFNEEFVIDEPTRQLMAKYLFITDNLHTDLHECLGHGSGKLLAGVDPDALGAHGSTLEETRADLFALYYLADPKLLEIGLLDNPDAYKAEYYKYILNGLMTQLMRIEPGKDIEESHMRNRQLIAAWAYEHGKKNKVIEFKRIKGETFIKINDYEALRDLFGQLLGEVQRIKSEGDYAAGAALVEKYAVKVDQKLHKEVLARYATLNIAPYNGFVNPVYVPTFDANGTITDVKVTYTEDFIPQMLRYSKDYSPLTK